MVQSALPTARLSKWIAFTILSLGHLHGAAETNGWSFMDAETSGIDYRSSDAAPAKDCRELMSVTDFDHSVISAMPVPASPARPGIL